MAQFSIETSDYLKNNRSIYEIMYLANNANGEIVSTVNPLPTIGTDYNAYGKQVLTIDDDTVQHTSKNRRKISGFEIIDYSSFQYDKQQDVWDEQVTGTASATFDTYLGMVRLNVGTNAGDQVIRQTKRVIRYIPGRQNEISMSVRFGTPETGIRRRFGIFDEYNGAYFEDGGDGTYYVVCRRNTASGVVEDRVAREDWNVDRLDGNGGSKIVADPTTVHLMVIEYEWYGAGQVEFKFVIDNNAYSVHQFNHANRYQETWSATSFLPVRVEFTNVTGVSGTHTFYHGSHSVLSEGEIGVLGREFSAATAITGYDTTVASTFYPALSIRLKSNRLSGVVVPKFFTAATLDNTNMFYRIVRNATITGGTWTSAGTNSHIEYNSTATAMANGEILQTGFISSGNQGNEYSFPSDVITQIARTTTTNLGDTSDILTIAVATVGANKDAFASLTWTEIR